MEHNLNEVQYTTCSTISWAIQINGPREEEEGKYWQASKHQWSVSRQTNNYGWSLGFIEHHRQKRKKMFEDCFCHLKLSTSDWAAQTKNSPHKRPRMLNTTSYPICWTKEAKLKKKNVGTVSTVEPLYTACAQHRSYIRKWALMTVSCLFNTTKKLTK